MGLQICFLYLEFSVSVDFTNALATTTESANSSSSSFLRSFSSLHCNRQISPLRIELLDMFLALFQYPIGNS